MESVRGRLFGARPGTWAVASLMLLAAVETLWSLVAPHAAPTDLDWQAAAKLVRRDFRAGDLIVAAPSWADPFVRLHLGDLIPVEAEARMDDARFGRVWEIGQRGAHAEEARGEVRADEVVGHLRVRLVERVATPVHYDFVSHWREARVTRWDLATRRPAPCALNGAGTAFACPTSDNAVGAALAEVDTHVRRAILAPPLAGALLAIEFAAVPLGRELAIRTGLHDVWARKYGTGTVYLKILIEGQPVAEVVTRNRSGWLGTEVDTRRWAGRSVPVRFEISSPAPAFRQFALAAESRG